MLVPYTCNPARTLNQLSNKLRRPSWSDIQLGPPCQCPRRMPLLTPSHANKPPCCTYKHAAKHKPDAWLHSLRMTVRCFAHQTAKIMRRGALRTVVLQIRIQQQLSWPMPYLHWLRLLGLGLPIPDWSPAQAFVVSALPSMLVRKNGATRKVLLLSPTTCQSSACLAADCFAGCRLCTIRLIGIAHVATRSSWCLAATRRAGVKPHKLLITRCPCQPV
jgi:hypothetical protein